LEVLEIVVEDLCCIWKLFIDCWIDGSIYG